MLTLTLIYLEFHSVMLLDKSKKSIKEILAILDRILPWTTTDSPLMPFWSQLLSSWLGSSLELEFGILASGTGLFYHSSFTWLWTGSLIFSLMLLRDFKHPSLLRENLKTETLNTCKDFYHLTKCPLNTSKKDFTEKVTVFVDHLEVLLYYF